jgi:hypothetical protein
MVMSEVPLSKYARKQMLRHVSTMFSQPDLDWLNQKPEFAVICLTAQNALEVKQVAETLLKSRTRAS